MVKVQLADLLQKICEKHSLSIETCPPPQKTPSFELLDLHPTESHTKVVQEIQKRMLGNMYLIHPMKQKLSQGAPEFFELFTKNDKEPENS
ncbi:hypothetical protein WDW89_05640 [Deltaproteobacteria bacterium TL4]